LRPAPEFEIRQEPAGSRPASLPFLGGAVGYLGYELAEFVEPVTSSGRNDLELPDLCLLFVDRLLAFDHLEGRAFALGLGFASGSAAAAERAELALAELLAEARLHLEAGGQEGSCGLYSLLGDMTESALLQSCDLLAAALDGVLADPHTAQKLGRAGRRRARELFSLDTMVQRHVDLYAEFMAGSRTRVA